MKFIAILISIPLLIIIGSCSEPARSGFNVKFFSSKEYKKDVENKRCYFKFNSRKNGTIESEYYMYNDSSFVRILYDTRNIVSKVSKFDKDRHLVWEEEYYSDGQLLSRRGYLDGHAHGESFKYYKDGRISEYARYENGFNAITIKYDEIGRALDTQRSFKKNQVREYLKYEERQNKELQEEKAKEEENLK